jgi:hypothetical protein
VRPEALAVEPTQAVAPRGALPDVLGLAAQDLAGVARGRVEDLPDLARRLAKSNREAMDLVGPVVLDLVGG